MKEAEKTFLRSLGDLVLEELRAQDDSHEVTLSVKSFSKFIEQSLKLRVETLDTTPSVVFDRTNASGEPVTYGVKPALGVVQKLIDGQYPVPRNGGADNKARLFCEALLDFFRNHPSREFAKLTIDHLREGQPKRAKASFSSKYVLEDDRQVPHFLAARLLDLASNKKTEERRLLDSKHTQGIFFLAATEGTIGRYDRGVMKIVFCDLFPDDLPFDLEHVYVSSNGDFYTPADLRGDEGNRINKSDLERIDLQRIRIESSLKPKMFDREIAQFILKRYKTDWDPGLYDPENSSELLKERSAEVLTRIAVMTCSLFHTHMDQLSRLFRTSLASGDLDRTVFDVQHGGVFVNQTDEGRYWTLAISPIQSRVHSADRLVLNEIIAAFDEELAKRRGQDH